MVPARRSDRSDRGCIASDRHADVGVSALWLLETANLLLGAQRRKRIFSDKRRELAAAAAAPCIKVDREPVSIVAIDQLAACHGLTVYDTGYLELALRRRLPLVTQDAALLAAMTEAGVAAR